MGSSSLARLANGQSIARTVDAYTQQHKLPEMMQFRRTFALVMSVTLVACERAKSPPPVDSATVKPAGVADSATALHVNNWDQSAGPLLLVVADSPNRAFVILPDSASASTTLANLPHPASVTLLSRSGTVQNAELPIVPDSGLCT